MWKYSHNEMLNNSLHLCLSNLLNITMHYTLTTSPGAAGITNQKFLLSQSNIMGRM